MVCKDKSKVILTIFSIVFACGLLLVLCSGSLGEYFSRNDNLGLSPWSTHSSEVIFKAFTYLVTGSLISLVSGFGLVLAIVKK